MGDGNDVTNKSFVGILTILLALAILIAFVVFLVLNLRHWRTQTYKIRVIQRRADIRNKKKSLKNNDTVMVKDVTTTEFKQFVLNEMIKIVVKMNSLRFKTVYWITCDKYYHYAIWVYLELTKCCKKCRKKEENKEDGGEEHAKNFNLLKPLSRFYHFINITGIVCIWLIVNLIIAVLVKYEKANQGISFSTFLIGVILSTLFGHICIMVITKILHNLYMRNIEDAFSEKKPKISLKQKYNTDTQKSEITPILSNEYKDTENLETNTPFNNLDLQNKPSSAKLDTFRSTNSLNSRPLTSPHPHKIHPEASNRTQNPPISLSPHSLPYLGDTEVLTSESVQPNTLFNTTIFVSLLGVLAFITFFCCIYTYHKYSQSVILSCLVMVVISVVCEVVVVRPISCGVISLLIMVKRKVKSKEIMMREIDEVKEELGLRDDRGEKLEGEDSHSQNSLQSQPPNLQQDQRNPSLISDHSGPKSLSSSEESKIETKQQETQMIDHLKQEAHLEKASTVPHREKKRQSKSEAAKIARYNIKLLESIYQAYEPDKADNVVKIFRKGGVFSVEPIAEEDFEESFESSNHDLESQGTMEAAANLKGCLNGGVIEGRAVGNTVFASGKGDQGTLDGIKEENSQLFEDFDDEKRGKLDKKRGKLGENSNDDIKNSKEGQCDKTGFEIDNYDKAQELESIEKDTDFNALANDVMAGAAITQLIEEEKEGKATKNNNRYEESSSEFEDETFLGFDDQKKKRKRRRRKKKKPKFNPKIKRLEEIYDNPKDRAKGGISTQSRMNTTRMSFNRHIPVVLHRDVTRKLSDIFSPPGNTSTKNVGMKVGSKTGTSWAKKKELEKQPTTLTRKKKPTRKLSESSRDLKSRETLLNQQIANAEARRGRNIREDNFLRTSTHFGGEERVHTRRSSSSRGFSEIRKKLKRGSSDKKKAVSHHDFALESRKIRDKFRSTKRKKFIRRKACRSKSIIRFDGDSPYMEHLIDRYREYKPKEKKYRRPKSNASHGSLVKRLGEAYSDTRSFAGESRAGSRASKRPSRKGSNTRSLRRIGTFKSQKSVSSSSLHSVRSTRSRFKRRRPKRSQSSNDDSFLKMANLVKQRVLMNKIL
ncbi:unnamed protein product [Moneuplotes crassus]|uniref:Uncharacterized protein n=1 Tax=Euplotes crassus TaxID=5936 RepID=A0AAD1XC84_EUPCR|nr:unnamed protein product [Moneuplotes crassus]